MDYIWTVIIGAAVVTYLPRVLPLVSFGKKEIPPLVLKWLGYIPPAVLAALLAPDILLNGQQLNLSIRNMELLAALPSFLVAIYTRSMLFTLVAGMLSFVVLNYLI